jgi:type I restriction enzyme, S subunit
VNSTSQFERRRLKFVASINDDALTEETDDDLEIRYIDIGNVNSSGEIQEIATYKFKAAPSRARRLVKDGDVIISTVRTYLKAIAPITNAKDNLVVSTGFAVIRPRKEIFDMSFCKYALREYQFINEVMMRSTGVSYPAINASDIADIRIPLPPLEVQKRIADYLDSETTQIDALILEKERMLELLEEKRAALISQAVTKGLNPSAPMKESGLEWLGKIPEHWKLERLKFSLYGIEQGWSPQCDNYPALPDSWGVLKVGAVNNWEFDADENKALPDNLEPVIEYEIKPGDVLMSRANTTQLVGSISFVREVRPKLLLCDKLYRLKVKTDRMNPEFLVLLLRTRPGRFEFERDASGASNSMQNIGQDSVYNLWTLLPPRDEQEKIVQHVKTSVRRTDKIFRGITTSLELLRERRSALITAAVTGQLEFDKVNS